mgnify:CR=1 FL=1
MIFKRYSMIFFLLYSIAFSSGDADNLDNLKKIKDPQLAWKLSIVPGLGQIYNEKYLKGSFFFLSEVILLRNISIYSADITMRNSLMWLAIGLYAYNIIDAYIDAELNTFSNKNKE